MFEGDILAVKSIADVIQRVDFGEMLI